MFFSPFIFIMIGIFISRGIFNNHEKNAANVRK